MPNNDETQSRALLYQENTKVALAFWEWRHKIITHFFTGVAALLALAGWFYKTPELRGLLFVPFLIGSIFSWILSRLDLRNAAILRSCYDTGRGIELEVRRDEGGIFKTLGEQGSSDATYTKTLSGAFRGTALIFLVLSAAVIFVSVIRTWSVSK
jgi:hypothetical protein